ncbi:MAG: 16S rRNA (guanine(527)-N(7))-methyltransferase RsmG [Planctomycetes bacterium]|nr:16S rRNA (guanine(527)-N(7))-methyltransferase RsmG [Planctomycetota bacterium]
MNDPLKQFSFLDDDMIEKFDKFTEILIEENAKINLTGIKDAEGIRLKHFVDSLWAVDLIEKNAEIIDVGSGAGFPSLALAIAMPNTHILSVESTGKKVKFQQRIIDALSLSNATVINKRAEDIANSAQYRESFDIAVGRAVANLSVLAELLLPFVHVGGKMLAWKSIKAEDEISDAKKAIKILGGKIRIVKEYTLTGEEELIIIVIEKIKNTPAKYPREFKSIKSQPLC